MIDLRKLAAKLAHLPLAWQGMILALVSLPIWILFAVFGQSSRGEVAWIGVGTITLVATAHWTSHQQRWFWFTLGVFLLPHLLLLWWDPLHGKHVKGATMTPFVFLDYLLGYAGMSLCEKCFGLSDERKK